MVYYIWWRGTWIAARVNPTPAILAACFSAKRANASMQPTWCNVGDSIVQFVLPIAPTGVSQHDIGIPVKFFSSDQVQSLALRVPQHSNCNWWIEIRVLYVTQKAGRCLESIASQSRDILRESKCLWYIFLAYISYTRSLSVVKEAGDSKNRFILPRRSACTKRVLQHTHVLYTRRIRAVHWNYPL